MDPGKPGKSWNFIVAFFKDCEVLEKSYWSWSGRYEVYGRQSGE